MIFTSFMKDYLIKGGLQKGDKVLLHSNLKYLFKSLLNKNIIFNLDDIADSILEFLGPKGTLVLPTFNFDFCNGKPFSFLDTQSQMGIFSEIFRNKNKLNRTWHPVYSFSIHGNIPVVGKHITSKVIYKDFILTSIFFNQKYLIQQNLNDYDYSELFLSNPTSKIVKVYLNKKKYFLKENSSMIINIGNQSFVSIISNCYFLRPIIFNYKNNYFDVHHG